MSPRRLGLSTTAIHGAPSRRPDWTPVIPSIVQSATYTNPVGADEDVLYTGSGNTPGQVALARKYALLEGADDAICLASGMAATALAHLAVLRPGDHLISSDWIYGGTRRFFDEELSRLGIGVTYVTPDQPRLWRRAARKATRAIFIESPTNPLLRVLDVDAVGRAAREQGLALLVDATFASPINFRPLEHGADIVITSATKYLNGHSDVLAGAVAGSASLVEEVNRLLRCWGPALDPHAAWLLDRGLRTLAVRMQRHNANGLAVAEWAARHPAFARVHYPGLPTHPDHAVARAQLAGFGGMVGLEPNGGLRAAEQLLRRLKLIAHAPSLAGVESLVSEPRLTSHRNLDPAARAAAGIPDGFLRLSCGLEDAEDIIADLAQAVGEKG
jgi:cystathionine beta-lyase/cystathionine gamma-synthase